MKRKLIYIALVLGGVFTSCDDFLTTESESRFVPDELFANESYIRNAMMGAYTSFGSSGLNSPVPYDLGIPGSDIEYGPEPYAVGGRYEISQLYPNNTVTISGAGQGSWNNLYASINRMNESLRTLENSPLYQEADKSKASMMTHYHGELITMRAVLYYELTRNWGDVPFFVAPPLSESEYVVTDRNIIQETLIEQLIAIESLMLDRSNVPENVERITKGFVQGMIARIALLRGGYSLRPAGYTGDGTVIQNDPKWGKMLRRNDWTEYYKIAHTYLKKVYDSGQYALITVDPRTPGDRFNNPFQYVFQQQMDLALSSESIFEISNRQNGGNSEWGFAFGRISNTVGSGYPAQSYGQVRFTPAFYYGSYDPADQRRDVTITMVGQNGFGGEVLYEIANKGSGHVKGGLGLNKWDVSRMAKPITAMRRSGINNCYMRMGDIQLLLAECEATLAQAGEGGYSLATAIEYMRPIRQRAFQANGAATVQAKVTDYLAALTTADQVVEAVRNERMWELAGEGYRKHDLIRWGIYADKIVAARTEWSRLIKEVQAKGYASFENGNELPDYIYFKYVQKEDLPAGFIKLTATCTVPDDGSELHALSFPGWRGNYDGWGDGANNPVHAAVKGLFKRLDATPEGYIRHVWASGWYPTFDWADFFAGYSDADYASNKPPRYLVPIPLTTVNKTEIRNEYDFPSE
ncbi:MAG: RagB/SusD family nutrient uptake outer membrane protein [Rikenellaceae bacterium]|jgi:hypothetical protein|nr:RagB/SusD family nutrient uptake outer membrane protein [Rikenellaceae bacterium]